MHRTREERRETTQGDASSHWRALPCPGSLDIRTGHRSAAERRRVLEWLNDGLRPERPGRLAREYPLVFARDSEAIPIVAWLHDAPVSFATLWPVSFRIGSAHLRVGLVSHVYTDEAHLREGLASRVIEAASAAASAASCGLVLLWSELEALYGPLGFERVGEELLVVVDTPTVERAAGAGPLGRDVHIETARAEDWADIERLRGFRTCQLELAEGAIRAARGTPDLDVQVARGPRGVEGFAMRGRGDDLQEVIHEWGGTPEAALACCRALLERCAPWNELFLMAPAANDRLSWNLRRAGAQVVRQPLAWMRIASCVALAEDLASLVGCGERLVVEPLDDDRSVRISSRQGECTLERRGFLESLFGSGSVGATDVAGVRRLLRAPLGERAVRRLPVPFHVAGLESI